jgi:transposase
MNDVDPVAWLMLTMARIANQWPSAELHALMPWNYNA